MGWTKRQIVEQAFAEIGLAAYAFDLGPEQMQDGLQRLDAMLATWNGKGVRLGYPLPSAPLSSDLDTDTGVPDFAVEAAYLGLAVRLAPGYGKAASPDTKTGASQALKALMARSAMPAEMRMDYTPAGAGNRTMYPDVFLPVGPDPLTAGPDSELEF